MDQLVKTLDYTMGKESGKEKKMTRKIYNPDIKLIMDSIDVLHCKIYWDLFIYPIQYNTVSWVKIFYI